MGPAPPELTWLWETRPRCVEEPSEPPVRAMNQEIHCHISVPGETHYLLLSGSLQPCLLGREPDLTL